MYVIPLSSEDNISSAVRYSYLSILSDDNADIFAVPLLILYYSILYLIFSSIVMINFYIFSKMMRLKHKGLSDGRVISLSKKEYGFVVHVL